MNKSELIKAIAEKTGESKAATESIVNGFMATVSEQLAMGGDVVLVGFGTFSVVHKEERQGRNPATGEPMTLKAKNAVKFSAGKQFKEAINQ